jgi:hypothetical protein
LANFDQEAVLIRENAKAQFSALRTRIWGRTASHPEEIHRNLNVSSEFLSPVPFVALGETRREILECARFAFSISVVGNRGSAKSKATQAQHSKAGSCPAEVG